MTAEYTPADTAPTTSAAPVARQAAVPAPPSWAWMRGALILAGAAQLITISALTSAAPLAAIAAVVLVAGTIAGIAHTGAFSLPALVVLAVGAAGIWRERG